MKKGNMKTILVMIPFITSILFFNNSVLGNEKSEYIEILGIKYDKNLTFKKLFDSGLSKDTYKVTEKKLSLSINKVVEDEFGYFFSKHKFNFEVRRKKGETEKESLSKKIKNISIELSKMPGDDDWTKWFSCQYGPANLFSTLAHYNFNLVNIRNFDNSQNIQRLVKKVKNKKFENVVESKWQGHNKHYDINVEFFLSVNGTTPSCNLNIQIYPSFKYFPENDFFKTKY